MLLRTGILIGLAINVGVGSIALYCIRLTLQRGFWHGRFAMLGMTAADVLYAILLILGVSQIQRFIAPAQELLLLIAGFFLLLLGLYQVRISPPKLHAVTREVATHSIRGDFFSVFLMTALHPAAIMIYIGVFSVVAVPIQSHRRGYIPVVLGVIIGGVTWWTPFIGASAYLKNIGSHKLIHYASHAASCIIAAIGLYLILDSLLLHTI